jgi:hypothetical protein
MKETPEQGGLPQYCSTIYLTYVNHDRVYAEIIRIESQ